MDNLTHSLLGAALSKTPIGRLSPLAAPILVIAANLPDTDIVVRLWGGPAGYLIHHRGITHAIVGVLALSIALAVCVRLVERRLHPETQGFGRLWWLCLVGLATHPLLDAMNNYGVRPWLPFDATWYYGDFVFIVDPWLWLIFGGAAALIGERTTRGSIHLALFAVAASALLVYADRGPAAVRIAFPAAAVAIAVARWRGVGRLHRTRWTVGFASLAAIYLATLIVCSRAAASAGRDAIAARLAPGETVELVAPNPLPADPTHWRVLARTDRSIWIAWVRLPGEVEGVERLDRLAGDGLVDAAWDSSCASGLRVFARFPHAAKVAHEDEIDVHLMDARYQSEPGELELVPGREHERADPTWSSAVITATPDGALECR